MPVKVTSKPSSIQIITWCMPSKGDADERRRTIKPKKKIHSQWAQWRAHYSAHSREAQGHTLRYRQPGGTGAHTAVPTAGRHRGKHCGAHSREALGHTLRCPPLGGMSTHCDAHRWKAKAEGSLLVHEIDLYEMVSSRPPQCWVACGREAGRRACTLSHQNRL